MKKNILATFAFAALAALGLPYASQAVGTEGDIYSITPVNATDIGRTFTAGEKFEFRVRLLASDWNSTTTPSQWVRVHIGLSTEVLDDVMFPPRLGLVIGGKLRTVDIDREEFVLNSDDAAGVVCTDLICSYKVQPGDLALPALMALAGSTEDSPIAADKTAIESGKAYFIENSNLWQYQNATTGDACQFYYAKGTTQTSAYQQWNDETTPALPVATTDYDLSTANFLVKGIDFDSTTEKSQDGTVEKWRVVRQNKESLKSSPAPIVTSGSPDEALKLYVWSENEDAVRMAGTIQTDKASWASGETMLVDFPTNKAGTLTVKRYVTLIKTESGKTNYSLTMKGVTQGETATIVLSPILGYRYNTAGDVVKTAYLTREVYCDEPEKPNVQISFEKDSRDGGKTKTVDSPMVLSSELSEYKIPVYITLSETYTKDVPLQLVVKGAATDAADPITNQNISVSQYEDFSTTDIAYTNLTIAAGSTETIVYVYPLGGDLNTQNAGIDFTVTLTGAGKDTFTVGQSAKLKLNSAKHKPTITATQDDVGAQEATGFEVPLQITDCYRDLQRTFKLDVTYSDGATFTTNVLFTEGVPMPVKLTGYGVNATWATIRATDSVNNTCSTTATVAFTVKPQKTISAALYDSTAEGSQHEGTKFNEGDPTYVRFTLSEKMAVGANRYAFLIPQNAASSNLVSCLAFTNGVLIAGGETNSTLTASCLLSLNDGCLDTDGTKGLVSYKIMLRTADKLTEGEEDTTFTDTQGLRFSVDNLYPVTKKIFVNGSNKAVESGTKWASPVPCQVEVPFVCQATDASAIDTEKGLITLWCFTEGRSPRQTYQYVAVTSSTETVTCKHTFTTPSVEQTVEVMTIDKDILAALKPAGLKTKDDLKEIWPLVVDRADVYSFTLSIESQPHVEVELVGFTGDNLNRMDETANGKEAKIHLTLSEPPEEDVTIQLIAKPWADDDEGSLAFYKGGTLPATDPEYPGCPYVNVKVPANAMEPEGKDTYKDGAVTFVADSLNGTAGSENEGWELIARIAEGSTYTDYFLRSEGNYFYVINLAPTVAPKQPEVTTTNKNVTIGQAFDISWRPSDVLADLKRSWPGTANIGLKTEWYINDAAVANSTKYITVGADGKKADQQTTSITLTEEGLNVVKLVISDYEGEDYHGVVERTWLYYIAPTKKLVVTPIAPGSPTTARYRGKGGIGYGRVWANGGAPVVSGFSQSWSYNVTTKEATAHAYGYASADAAYADDGTLGAGDGKYDIALDKDGESWVAGRDYYNYTNFGYDNYFYRWVHILPSDNGGTPEIEYDPINPTFSPLEKRDAVVVLDEYEAEKAAYVSRRLEAVFSREFLPSDNIGDINGDGVPDCYLISYPDLGVSDADGNVDGDDMLDLGKFNDDEDYLPNTLTAKYASFIPGLEGTWVSAGRAFTARMEIRGENDNLNDAPTQADKVSGPAPERCYLDPLVEPTKSTLSFLEYVAFTNWCARQATPLDPTVADNWAKWSPERPTDPTVADTDGDEIPDGYEYFFWYKAHVGQLETKTDANGKVTTNYVRITGRRYNPADPFHPTTITTDEIEAVFDPLVANSALSSADTDNDGLLDLIEFEVGTNPFDYDSDGDGLPDGYEELFLGGADAGFSPLKSATNGSSDASRNDDGDYMAICTTTMIPVRCAYTNSVAGDVAKSLAQTNLYWAEVADAEKLTKFELRTGGDFPEGTYSNLVTGVVLYDGWTYRLANGNDVKAIGKQAVNADASKNLVIYSVGGQESVYALHYQVYRAKGFDPRTAWKHANQGGINSAPYTAMDEFLSLSFFYRTGGLSTDDITPTASMPWENIWLKYSTNPLNCDTDGDNIPDGWELYMMGAHPSGGSFSIVGGAKRSAGSLSGLPPIHQLSPLWDYHSIPPGFTADLKDADGDGLNYECEWCGVDCCANYSSLSNCHSDWRNKKWPTDSADSDTDGDGLTDGAEYTWLYGTSGVEGGGLNPLSWDTDSDGLPDPWELEFAGTYTANSTGTATTTSTNSVTTGSNTTTSVSTSETTVTTAGSANGDGMNPTLSDPMLDYDHDGLNNWQEYMVGAMRCWRYDDVTSPWTILDLSDTDYQLAQELPEEEWANWWGHTLVETWRDTTLTTGYNEIPRNPGLRNGFFDPGTYFSCCVKSFDPVRGKFYLFKDGIYHDLRDDLYQTGDGKSLNRWMYRLAEFVGTDSTDPQVINGTSPIYPTKYICCDPRLADTDNDGMDDYYELFHGLNPLLGSAGGYRSSGGLDIVHIAWGGSATFNPVSALANRYIYTGGLNGQVLTGTFRELEEDVRVLDPDMSPYDFYQFPWLAGLSTVDVDGDNIRNQQEAILSKVQAAATYQHTDPTPLWMTDTSYDKSLTARYYQLDNPSWADNTRSVKIYNVPGTFKYRRNMTEDEVTYSFNDFPWLNWTADASGSTTGTLEISYDINYWKNTDTMFSYEENEGYDSDHDYLSDFEESQGKTKSASDPQQHDSPLRHQAMWFGGEEDKGWLQTPLQREYSVPEQAASSELRQAFLYYTVEAWVKPDATILVGDDQLYTAVERAVWTGKSSAADWSYLRKNFYIGLKNGRWYTKFDSTGTDLNQPVEIVDGPMATTNWTHVAATFGPSDDYEAGSGAKMELRLYVNGVTAKSWKKETAIQPEHGEAALTVNGSGEMTNYSTWGAPLVSILVGASAKTSSGLMFEQAWESRAQGILGPDTTEDDYTSFFKGYIDEVRIWDGARKADDILSDYENRVRYTAELAAKNREEVYEAFAAGALRSPANEADILMPAELCFHWAFDHIPSAVSKTDVLQTPAGFTTAAEPAPVTDAKAMWSRPTKDPDRLDEPWICTWWDSCAVASQVYANRAWVPWINDTVSHLPFLDGTTSDSIYWSEDYAGYDCATNFGYASFDFPRTAEVWSLIRQQSYDNASTPWTQMTRWTMPGVDETLFRFARRNRYETGADLLPMMGAYAKRISTYEGGMWDDESASDVWAETGPDGDGGDPDNDGLPTWWEEIALNNYAAELPAGVFDVGWDTIVTYDGKRMSAHEAYLRDLTRGMLPDGEYHIEYADTRDSDKDGVIDYYANLYNLADGQAGEDDDGDGLSNYAEYLITEVFRFAECDPSLYATDGTTCDYFLKVGDLYLGEIFTDHDQMDDVWEAQYDSDYIDRGIYDPNKDADGDGWSNYAEYRAGTDPTTTGALSIDGYVCPEYPVPAIAANLIYNGSTPITEAIVVQAWNEANDPNRMKVPDATWTLGESESSEETTSSSDSSSDGLTTHEKFIGRKPTGERTYYLSGGNVAEGSFKLLYMDKTFGIVTYNPITQLVTPVAVGEPEDAKWYYSIVDQKGQLVRSGGTLYKAMGYEATVVGTIDYKTGKVTIDFSADELCGQRLADPETAETDDGDDDDDDETSVTTYDYIDLDNSYVRIEWQSSSALMSGTGLHYLSDPDEASATTFGHLREGKTTFVAFADNDGDGAYSAGEPYGVIRNVDVGWSGAAFDLELTDTTPIFARVKLADGSNDRTEIFGSESGNATTNGTASASSDDSEEGDTAGLTGGTREHIRIVPYSMSSVAIDTSTTDREFVRCLSYLPNRVVAEFDIDTSTHPFITEADFLSDTQFDIDWDGFATTEFSLNNQVVAALGDVTAVRYQIILGSDGAIGPAYVGDTSTVYRAYSTLFERRFEPTSSRTTPTGLKLAGGNILYSARPTFMWRLDEPTGVNNLTKSSAFFGCSYTAFEIQVMDANGTVVWDSGVVRAPARDADGYFTWQAPLSAGNQTALKKVFSQTGDWTWHVAMYNAKFKPKTRANGWSSDAHFSTAVCAQQDTDDHGYGSVQAAVKYVGPAAVLADADDLTSCEGIVRVQAFARPDFAGVPEAETVITNVADLANASNFTANVKLGGLKEGTYYIRAYIDTNGNMKKDDWESWGTAAKSVAVTTATVPTTATVWIEDADTDTDWLPDAWEYKTYGGLSKANALASVDSSGKIILKTATYTSLKNGYAGISSALPGASLSLFMNLDAAKLLLNLGDDTTTDTVSAIRAAIIKRVNPGSVKITSLTMNRQSVAMTVAANVEEPETAALFSAVYTVPQASTVTVNVYRASSLSSDAEWTLVEQKTVQVNAALDATFEVPLDEDLSSGFYKVEVVE